MANNSSRKRGYDVEEEDRNQMSSNKSHRGDNGGIRGDFSKYNYYGRPEFGDDEDWKCLECKTWNYPDEHRCARCGKYPDFGLRNNALEKDNDVDEFGRSRPPPKSIWPPSFDTGGSAFVLDPGSGLFYESHSDFFYNPRTRLYYSNKEQEYYKYHGGKFEQVDAPIGEVPPLSRIAGSSNLDPEPVMQSLQARPAETKKSRTGPIAINLKTKSLKKAKVAQFSSGSDEPAAAVAGNKEHEQDIAKWSQRQQEAKQDATVREVQRTAKGEPICTLCQRKFPTIEKLEYHVRVSKLHADNLRKYKEQQENDKAAAKEETAQSYVDRAAQRRVLYGEDQVSVGTAAMASISDSKAVPASKTTLDERNVGHQLLQKLGWNPEDADAVPHAMEASWDRIERIAQGMTETSKKPKTSTGGIGVHDT